MNDPSRAWLSARGVERSLVAMVVVSALTHAAVVVIFVMLPEDLFSAPPPTEVAYTVRIVDPDALGGRIPKGDPEPAGQPEPEPPPEPEPDEVEAPPEPPPEEDAVALPEEKPTPKPTPEPKPTVPPKPKPTPRPTLSPEEQARRERDRRIQEAIERVGKGTRDDRRGQGGIEEGPGKALGSGGDGGGGGELRGLDFILYKNRVEATIRDKWTWVGSNPDLTVRVGFGIDADGRIGGIRVVDPSGDPGFDASVLRAVRAASPLPPPPESYREAFSDYLIDFLSGDLQKK